MDSPAKTWNRSKAEFRRLVEALERHCDCESRVTDPTGERCATCPMRLLNEQASLDRFAWVCAISHIYDREEWQLNGRPRSAKQTETGTVEPAPD